MERHQSSDRPCESVKHLGHRGWVPSKVYRVCVELLVAANHFDDTFWGGVCAAVDEQPRPSPMAVV